jgi:hypothetical protein
VERELQASVPRGDRKALQAMLVATRHELGGHGPLFVPSTENSHVP